MALGEHLSTEEVAEQLGVTPGRVRQFVYEERLEVAEKVGSYLFFHKDEIKKFLKKPRNIGRPKNSKNS